MTFHQPLQARLLVVEQERSLREALLSLFLAEGYVAGGVASLEEALKEVARQSYELILADLAVGVSKHSFTPAHLLRRRVLSTPLGLLTAQPNVLEAPHASGFAFALPRPVDVSVLLTEVAASLKLAPGLEQPHQAQRIKRFLEAWSLQEWKSLLGLCTEEVTCYPPSLFTYTGANPVQGKLGLLSLVTSLRRRYQSMRFEVQGIYGRPLGLAVRTSQWVAESGKGWETFPATALFAFAGERICQIGIPLSMQQQQVLMEFPPALWGQGRSS